MAHLLFCLCLIIILFFYWEEFIKVSAPFVSTLIYFVKDLIEAIDNRKQRFDRELRKNQDEEYCGDQWLKLDSSGLLRNFEHSLYGQHLVHDIVTSAIREHIKSKQRKALVMSFHGPTGVGKNLVSRFIAESLYKKGAKSKYVHLYVSAVHFPHESRVPEYRDNLQRDVVEATWHCQRSLFIFDEVDKMPIGLIDVLKIYMERAEIGGVDYTKNIFIFLSNAGASDISKTTLKFLSEGKEREQITLQDVERYVSKDAFNNAGGLYGSEIVAGNLIDRYVPFLPLEKKHVKLCIEDRIKAKSNIGYRSISQAEINNIVKQMEFVPPEKQIFSESGCKRIDQKIDIYLNEF